MARKREFDFERAMERAMLLFWKKGYSGASLRDLLKTMKIGEGSFYSAFGSKKALFLRCLARYNDTVSRRRLAALNSGATAKVGVRAFFKTVLDELNDPATPRICLLAGSLATDVLEEASLKKIVLRDFNDFGGCFTKRLQAAKESGEFPDGFDVDAAAQVLITYLQGLFRVLGVLHNRAEVERQVAFLLDSLGL